jgi:SprT-like family protein
MIEPQQLEFAWSVNEPVNEDEVLDHVFDRAVNEFAPLTRKHPRPLVEARFYPYAGLSSTVRLRSGRVYARVSDILKGAPTEVLYALACILIAKLYRARASKEHERTYREHTLRPAIVDAAEAARKRRGYKITTSPRGKVYDLGELFEQLNQRYFEGKIARPRISWSQRETRRVLGHHDHVHGAIIISRTLDKPKIPRLVVEYVLYHEMLHVKHPPRVARGRTVYHGRDFRLDERKFDRLDEALKCLAKIELPGRKRSRRRVARRLTGTKKGLGRLSK